MRWGWYPAADVSGHFLGVIDMELKTIYNIPIYDLNILQEKYGGKQIIFNKRTIGRIKGMISDKGLDIIKNNMMYALVYIPVKTNSIDDDIFELSHNFKKKEIVKILAEKYSLSERAIYYRISRIRATSSP